MRSLPVITIGSLRVGMAFIDRLDRQAVKSDTYSPEEVGQIGLAICQTGIGRLKSQGVVMANGQGPSGN